MLSQVATPDECLRCGACCAHFRVSFYWAEAELIDEHLVEPLTPVYSCMRGTNRVQPRCQALTGEIGKEVGCSIYGVRSSTCREVQVGDEQCNKARLAHQLIPLIRVNPADSENDHDYDQVS
ncbi:YkgJ family cysteine cluster protein [Acinetobacter geminorum]